MVASTRNTNTKDSCAKSTQPPDQASEGEYLTKVMLAEFLRGKKKSGSPSRRVVGSSQDVREFPCMNKRHRNCKWSSKADIQCDDGSIRSIAWQKCRKDDARTYIRQYKTPGDGEDIMGDQQGPEAQPAQTQQAAQPQQAEQPQGPYEESAAAAAGPSSAQAYAAAEAAQQTVSQQEADTSGWGNTVPGPFGQHVPGPTAPPLDQEDMPFAQGWPGCQGTVYSPERGYPQDTGHYEDTPFAGAYGGQSSAGEYEGGYDMPFSEDYGEGEEFPMAGGFTGSGGDFMPQQSTMVASPSEARGGWVETRPENLYHSDETDGVVKNQPYVASPSVWTQTNYSKF